MCVCLVPQTHSACTIETYDFKHYYILYQDGGPQFIFTTSSQWRCENCLMPKDECGHAASGTQAKVCLRVLYNSKTTITNTKI